ncbi:MAG: polyphosphate:AMP phosphotransferase [Pseudomonadota bacterium]
MFEAAEVGSSVTKDEFKQREPVLRQELLELQQELRKTAAFPVIVVFAGVDGGGKGQTVNLLNEWMDPRWIVTRAYNEPTEEERDRPEYWRFWRDLPPKGQLGLFLSSWYSRPVLDRVYGKLDLPQFVDSLDRIVAFENALTEDGAVLLKFWMHLSKPAQKRRLKNLEKDPLTRWRVTERDWKHWNMYERFIETAERTIMRTSTGRAPWTIVEGEDFHYRSLTVGTLIRDAVRKRLDDQRWESEARHRIKPVPPQDTPAAAAAADEPQAAPAAIAGPTVLSKLDMSNQLSKKDYQRQLREQQARLSKLCRAALEQRVSTILVFEGPDAAGKGGNIRRITGPLDARNYQVLPFAAPTDEERAHHYLWRFWRHLSRAGRLTIYDRSWYGRVLVERVEGYADETAWRRAYAEINDFEEQLIEHGIVLVKYWVHISKDEQLARFQAREQIPYKRWKLTDEDWRNRERWDEYEQAVHDMVQHTSTINAPWTLVEGNDKRYARIKTIQTVADRLEQRLRSK